MKPSGPIIMEAEHRRSKPRAWHGARQMAGRRITIKGFRLDKTGRVVRDLRRLDVSARLRQKSTKRVRVVTKRTPTR